MAELGPWGWLLVVRMAGWRLALSVLKRLMPLERLVRLTASPGARQRDLGREELAVRVTARLWRSSEGPCLERSLALHRELGRLGARPELVLGMSRVDSRLVGHAWVVVDGHPLFMAGESFNDSVLLRFDLTGTRTRP